MNKFPSEVCNKLGYYVYRLIDPRNGETFYVGKGKNNRVFAHINQQIDKDGDEITDKLQRIRDIKITGLEVLHIIHRHGMDEQTALEVEAALIDAYAGLSNEQGGHNNDFGSSHAKEIIQRYQTEIMDFQHKALLISVNRSATEKELYEAVRYAWRINATRASEADIVIATVQGVGKGVFFVDKWLPATSENFPGRETRKGRYGFIGREADDDIKKQYIGKRVPDEYRRKGAASPCKYTWKQHND